MIFTLYRNCRDVSGQSVAKTWKEWIESLSNRSIRPNKDGPAFILGEVEGRRSKANVVSVHAIGLDIEGAGDTEIMIALKELEGVECFLYTTHSHHLPGKGARFRVIVPLANPIPPDRHLRVWEWLRDRLGDVVDAQTKDCSRLHFLPSAFDATGHMAFHNPGEMLDPDNLPEDEDEVALDFSGAERQTLADEISAYLRFTHSKELREAGKRLADGAPFAKKGERHSTMINVTWQLSAKFAHVPTAMIVDLFRESIAVMGDGPDLAAVAKAWEGAVQKRKNNAWNLQRRGERGYSEEELAGMREKQSVSRLDRQWVVQKDTTFYVLAGSGYHKGPFTLSEARAAALQILQRAPVPMTAPGKNGPRRRTIQEVVETHGSVASKVVADLRIQGSVFDPKTGILYEAVCPRRAIEPKADPEIDQWLKILGGEQYEKLLDWLACVPDTKRLLCAIYLAGCPGSGKTLLAHGLARIWTTGSITELHNVMADFNEELAFCPVVIGDEALPKTWRGNSVTTKLRSMVSVTHRTLNRKHKAPADLVGAIRLVLTANNEFLLQSDGASSSADLKAIAQRFLYIPTPETASTYLDNLNQATRDRWLDGDGLAAHVLHLYETRDVRTEGRFAVQGDVTTMHRLLLTGTTWNSMVCEWLVRYLMAPTLIDHTGKGLIRRDNGKMLVNDQALIDNWDTYLKTHKDPDTSKIGQALRTISIGKRVQLRFKGKRIRYREIDLQHLCAWSEQHNIGDVLLIQSLGEDSGSKTHETDDLASVPGINRVPI